MADNKFLDQAGLQIVWDKIKNKFADKVALTELESALEGDYSTTTEMNVAIQTAIDNLVDGAPAALNTLKELADALESEEGVIVTMQESITANAADIAELKQDSVPAFDSDTGKYFFANGQPIFIAEHLESGVADGSVDVTYYLGTKYQTINVPNANQVTFFGGGDGRVKNVEYPGASIVMNSGVVKNLVGGGLDNCTVGSTSIVVNGGRAAAILGGGFGDNLSPNNGAGNVGYARIIINGGTLSQVWGGGQNITNTGVTEVEIYDGTITYLTTGGSNGSTSIGTVTVYGGTVDVWQAGNRGTVENSTMILDGGTINKMYCVGETEDATVTANVEFSTVSIRHGSVTTLRMGNTNYGGHATSGTVKGEYRENIVANDTDNILPLFSKIVDTELEALTTVEIEAICK